MTEWTSLSVTEEQKSEIKDAKPDNMAMGKFLVQSIGDNSNSNSNPIDTEEIANELTATIEVDTDEVVNGVLDGLSDELDVTVNIDGESDLDETDVRNLVEKELEKSFEDLKRGRMG